MSYDVLALVYQGQYANATFLQVLNAKSINLEDTNFGGIGRGKYVFNAATEDLTNVVAPNRIDAYLRRDVLTQSIAIGATTVNVHDGTRFSVGQGIAIYDGIHFDLAKVTAIASNTVTFDTATANAYALGSTVLVLRHTGRISAVDADANRQNLQNVETMSYFQQLNDFVVNENVQTGTGPGYECGWVIWNTLQKYADSLDLVLTASNFVMSSDGSPATGGTGQAYSGTNSNTQLLSFLQEVVNVANGQPNGASNDGIQHATTYNLWVDEHNALHFGTINTTTATATLHLDTYGSNSVGDGLFDCVTSHVVHDQDLTTIKNTYSGVGGKDSTGNPVTAIVFDQNSVNQYGQKEAVLTNPSLTDVPSLTAWLTSRLNLTAYPARQYTTQVGPSLTYLTCRDFVTITGYTDNHTESYTPQSVQTSWDADSTNGQFRQSITGAELLPDINRTMRAIAAEHYIPTTGVTAGGVNLTDRFVQSGLDGSYSYKGTTFSVASGVINANIIVGGQTLLTEFDISAWSFTPGSDDTFTVAYLYRNADGTKISSPQIVVFSGFSTSGTPGIGYTDYQVIPLWVVTRTGGYITNADDRRFMGGIKTANINAGAVGAPQMTPNPNLSTAPVLAGGTSVTGPTYPVSGGGSYDAAVTFTLSIGNPAWLSEVRLYACPVNQTYKSYRVFKGDLTPNASGSYTGLYNLPSGTAYDLYVCYVDQQSNESQDALGNPIALKLATTVQQPLSSASLPTMPNGTIPAFSGAAGTIAFVEAVHAYNNSATSITGTYSATPSNNDYLVAFVTVDSGKAITTPTGWTLVSSLQVASKQSAYVFERIASSETGAAYTFAQTGSADYMSVTMERYTGVSTTSPRHLTANLVDLGDTTGATWTGPSVTPTISNGVAVGFFATNDTRSIANHTAGWTEDNAFNGTASSTYTSTEVQRINAVNGTTYAPTITWGTATLGTPCNIAFTMVLQPTSNGGSATIAYPNVGGATYDAQTAVTLTNGSTASTWLEAIEAVAQPSNQSNNWTVYNEYAANATGAYSFVWGGLGAGGTYSVGVRFRDFKGNVSGVLTLGTTVANPVQGAAIALGAVGVGQTTGIFDGNGQMLYSKTAPALQSAVLSDGTVVAGQVTGQLSSSTNSSNVAATIGTTAQTGANGSTYLNNNAVSTSQVQSVSIISTQLAQNRYDTTLANVTGGLNNYKWYRTNGTAGAVDNTVTLGNNDLLTYDIGTAKDISSGSPAIDALVLAPSSAVTLSFKHPAFTAGGVGQVRVGFTGSSVSPGANTSNSPAVSGSDQPSISHSTNNNYSEQLQQHSFASTTRTATITQTANATTYTATQHSTAYNNGNDANHYSGATFGTGGGYAQGMTGLSGTSNCPGASCACKWTGPAGDQTLLCTPSGGGNGSPTTLNFSVFVAPSSSYPVTGYLNFSGFVSNANVSTSVSIVIKDGAGTTQYSGTYSSNAQWTSPSITTGATGSWSITITGNTSDNSGDSANFSFGGANVSWSGQMGGYKNTTTYNMADGSFSMYQQVNCVAPTGPGTQLEVDITGTSYGTDAYGNSYAVEIVVQKADGSGTWVIDTRAPSNGNTFTYYNASETCTSFYVWMRAIATAQGSGYTGTLTYYPNIALTYKWFQNDANPATYSYPATNDGSTSYYTDNNANIDAPTSSSPVVVNATTGTGPIGVVIQSLSTTSNSYGASGLYLDIVDKNGNTVVSQLAITATGNYAYSLSTAVAGQYQFKFYAKITTNNSNAPGTQNFPVTFSGYTYDYNHTNAPSTVWVNYSGQAYQYLTSGNTVAPTAAGSQLSLALTSVTTPANSSGTTFLVVQLKNPSGTVVQTWNNITTAQTFTYSAAGAPSGVWTWNVFGQAANNATSDSQYNVSWSGTQTYYIPGAAGGNTYVIASNGATQRTATNDNDIDFVSLSPDTISFQVFNNAAQAVGFTLSLDVSGV